MRRALVAIAGVAALFLAGARAAEAPAPKPAAKSDAKPAPAAGAQTPTPPPEPLPPYEPQLLRLAEIMGALAYLRDLCGAGDGVKFRSTMNALLEADGVSDSQRDLLAGAYNRGFEGYRLTYRTCNATAAEVVARFLAETARLSAELAGRYGG